jgi:hypothetical protein
MMWSYSPEFLDAFPNTDNFVVVLFPSPPPFAIAITAFS